MTVESQNEISPLIFPKDVFFKFRAPNADEFIAAIEKHPKKIANDDEEFAWGKLFSSSDKVALDYGTWGEYLIPSINHLSKLIGFDLEWSLDSCWMNLYKRGDFQEPHDHTGKIKIDLCCVFFANSGKDFAEFFFFDVHHGRLGPFWSKVFGTDGVLIFHEDVIQAGDILFFPPYLFHGVRPHNSDTIRTTFSANIFIHDLKPIEKSVKVDS